jgi:hypothetical protein
MRWMRSGVGVLLRGRRVTSRREKKNPMSSGQGRVRCRAGGACGDGRGQTGVAAAQGSTGSTGATGTTHSTGTGGDGAAKANWGGVRNRRRPTKIIRTRGEGPGRWARGDGRRRARLAMGFSDDGSGRAMNFVGPRRLLLQGARLRWGKRRAECAVRDRWVVGGSRNSLAAGHRPGFFRR